MVQKNKYYFLGALIAAAIIIACSSSSTGSECSQNSDCRSNLCIITTETVGEYPNYQQRQTGTCAACSSNTTDSEDPNSQFTCSQGVCNLDSESEDYGQCVNCYTNGGETVGCNEGDTCSNGSCVEGPDCTIATESDDCPTGQRCSNGGECVTEDPCSVEDSSCNNGLTCDLDSSVCR